MARSEGQVGKVKEGAQVSLLRRERRPKTTGRQALGAGWGGGSERFTGCPLPSEASVNVTLVLRLWFWRGKSKPKVQAHSKVKTG